jgi:hypothetical protein
MLAALGAIFTAVAALAEKPLTIRFRNLASVAVLAAALGGCLPVTVPLAGADPADRGAKSAGVGYRSTIAPYTSLRPAAPSAWREQNDRVAPPPKPDQ